MNLNRSPQNAGHFDWRQEKGLHGLLQLTSIERSLAKVPFHASLLELQILVPYRMRQDENDNAQDTSTGEGIKERHKNI